MEVEVATGMAVVVVVGTRALPRALCAETESASRRHLPGGRAAAAALWTVGLARGVEVAEMVEVEETVVVVVVVVVQLRLLQPRSNNR